MSGRLLNILRYQASIQSALVVEASLNDSLSSMFAMDEFVMNDEISLIVSGGDWLLGCASIMPVFIKSSVTIIVQFPFIKRRL